MDFDKEIFILNRYRIVEKIASGGMADIYLGEDLKLKRKVAVKILSRNYAGDRNFIARFKSEAQVLASLALQVADDTLLHHGVDDAVAANRVLHGAARLVERAAGRARQHPRVPAKGDAGRAREVVAIAGLRALGGAVAADLVRTS